jgi:hypothetical protein
LLALCLVAVDSRATPAAASAGAPAVPPWWCLRGKRLPDCRGFFLAEFHAGYAFQHFATDQHFDGSRDMAEGALGYLWNLDRRQAVGGLVFVEGGGSAQRDIEVRAGLRFRYRYWLTDLLSVDASPGVVVAGVAPIGFSGDLAFNIGDLVAPYLRLEVIRGLHAVYPGVGEGEPAPAVPSLDRTVFSAGLQFGSYATAIIAGAILIALPIFVVVQSNRRFD